MSKFDDYIPQEGHTISGEHENPARGMPDKAPSESNGAKAARLAAEHVSELEAQLEAARSDRDKSIEYNREQDIRLDECRSKLAHLQSERDYYMLQVEGLRQAVRDAGTLILNAVERAEQHPFKPKE